MCFTYDSRVWLNGRSTDSVKNVCSKLCCIFIAFTRLPLEVCIRNVCFLLIVQEYAGFEVSPPYYIWMRSQCLVCLFIVPVSLWIGLCLYGM